MFLFHFRCFIFLFYFALISVSCHNSWFYFLYFYHIENIAFISNYCFPFVHFCHVLSCFFYSFPFCFVLLSIFLTCCTLLGRSNQGGVGGARKSERKTGRLLSVWPPSPPRLYTTRANHLETLLLLQKFAFLFLLIVFLFFQVPSVFRLRSFFLILLPLFCCCRCCFFTTVLLSFSLPSLAGTVSDMFCLRLPFFLVSFVFVFPSFLVRFKLSSCHVCYCLSKQSCFVLIIFALFCSQYVLVFCHFVFIFLSSFLTVLFLFFCLCCPCHSIVLIKGFPVTTCSCHAILLA